MKTGIKFIQRFLSIVFIASILVACAKDGEPGPIGLQGEQGEKGEQGPEGSIGTANVIYSGWKNVEWNGADENDYKRFDINDPAITDEFLKMGTALMFMRIGWGVFPLPRVSSNNGQIYSFVVRPNAYEGYPGGIFPTQAGLSFFIKREEGVASGGVGPVRYVLIPGGIPVGGKSTLSDYTKMSYQEITELFNIPE